MPTKEMKFGDYVSIKIAETKDERDRAYRIRKCVYCIEKKWMSSEEESDGYDEGSIHLIANVKIKGQTRTVGTLRVTVKNGPIRQLPLERYTCFEISSPDPGSSELSRLAVEKEYRRHDIEKQLALKAKEILEELHCRSIYIVGRLGMIHGLNKTGFNFEPITDFVHLKNKNRAVSIHRM